VRAIAERLILGLLAAAEKDLFGFIRRKCDRGERGAFMHTGAEWLMTASSA
jgi:hypothetical protein